MSTGTKVTIAIVVLFAVLLGIYYGFGGPPGSEEASQGDPGSNDVPAFRPADGDEDPLGLDPVPDTPDRPATGPPVVPPGPVDAVVGAGAGPRDLYGAPRLDPLPPGNTPVLGATADRIVPVAPAAPDHRPVTPPAAVSQDAGGGEYVEYRVKPDDSLWTIAAESLGDPVRWKEILKANPTLDPDRLRVGQRLRLPRRQAARHAPGPEPRLRVDTGDPGVVYHVVDDGDTLTDIADRFYGSTVGWTAIWEANRDLIGANPDRLRVGTRLRIPDVR